MAATGLRAILLGDAHTGTRTAASSISGQGSSTSAATSTSRTASATSTPPSRSFAKATRVLLVSAAGRRRRHLRQRRLARRPAAARAGPRRSDRRPLRYGERQRQPGVGAAFALAALVQERELRPGPHRRAVGAVAGPRCTRVCAAASLPAPSSVRQRGRALPVPQIADVHPREPVRLVPALHQHAAAAEEDGARGRVRRLFWQSDAVAVGQVALRRATVFGASCLDRCASPSSERPPRRSPTRAGASCWRRRSPSGGTANDGF